MPLLRYNKPLTPHFAAAERKIIAEQLKVDEVQKHRHLSAVRILRAAPHTLKLMITLHRTLDPIPEPNMRCRSTATSARCVLTAKR